MSDPSNRIKKEQQDEIQRQIDEFLARGGEIKVSGIIIRSAKELTKRPEGSKGAHQDRMTVCFQRDSLKATEGEKK